MYENRLIPPQKNLLSFSLSDKKKIDEQATLDQLVSLVKTYGTREARRMWAAALSAAPAKRGRPLGARAKEGNFDVWRALQCLHAFANFPETANWTRWQVIRFAAEHIADFGGAGALPNGLPDYPRVQDPKVSSIKIKQNKARKVVVERFHIRLTREQSRLDANREHAIAIWARFCGNDPASVLAQLSPEERAQVMADERLKAEQQWPAIPQKA